jgi:hypothetical protein
VAKLNIPKRLPYECALLAALLLGSCSQGGYQSKFSSAQRDEISDLARDATLGEFSADRERLDAIEQKLNMPNGG